MTAYNPYTQGSPSPWSTQDAMAHANGPKSSAEWQRNYPSAATADKANSTTQNAYGALKASVLPTSYIVPHTGSPVISHTPDGVLVHPLPTVTVQPSRQTPGNGVPGYAQADCGSPPPVFSPLGQDSWSFTPEKTRARFTSEDLHWSIEPSSTGFGGTSNYRGDSRSDEKRKGSSSEALTFYRYGPPPKTRRTVQMITVSKPSQAGRLIMTGPPGNHEDYNISAYRPGSPSALLELGEEVEGYRFSPATDKRLAKKRPSNWRSDYRPRRGLLSFVRTLLRLRAPSDSNDDMPKTLDRLLTDSIEWRRRGDAKLVAYDLRAPPKPNKPSARATTPPSPWMRLYHHALPWYIDVEATSSQGITVADILSQIHQHLTAVLTERDIWNEDVKEETRRIVAQGLRRRERTIGSSVLRLNDYGPFIPLRVDFLGHSYVFEGLVKGRNGMWEIKTRDWRD